MGSPNNELTMESACDQVLGYLNFSSGNHDPGFFRVLNQVFHQVLHEVGQLDSPPSDPGDLAPGDLTSNNGVNKESLPVAPVYQRVGTRLRRRLNALATSNATYQDAQQAERVLEIVFDNMVPIYRQQHADLLFHQTDDQLFNSFFLGRCCELVLANGFDDAAACTQAALQRLNDYLGHRPVATLETRKLEPYGQEWIRPVPIMVRDAGFACGPYQQISKRAIEILQDTDPDILQAAHFDPERLQELAFDPRAFDFDHPANKRPNYHFGQWDDQHIDGDGFYYRFVIHEVTLDSLLSRVDRGPTEDPPVDPAEALTEAAAVLAGTMLMAAGICGQGPGAYDSHTTLSSLLPVIAGYRNDFYEQLLQQLPVEHRERLQQEQKVRQQPFGAARQDLNACLAQRRASQLVNCRLASIFARMGYPDAALKQSEIVPVASARLTCQIDCLLGTAKIAIQAGQLEDAFQTVPDAVRLLKRGIECGAIVDPWNILGFDANYSVFPALEDTVVDHRVFELVDLVERILALCSTLWSEAAAQDMTDMCRAIRNEFSNLVLWWRRFAAHEVMSVEAVDAQEIFEAAQLVAEALNLWHRGGAETGDISFWSQHARLFDSPKAYSLVIDALMQRSDYQTSSALLVHWISQAETIPLQLGDSSFHVLFERWITEQKSLLNSSDLPVTEAESSDPSASTTQQTPEQIWESIRKFYDFIEANAGVYWDVPDFQLDRRRPSSGQADPDRPGPEADYELVDEDDSEDESSNDLFKAAYDEVVYTDSTDDGFEGEVFDGSLSSDDELEAEVDRVLDRLEFLETIASYWRVSATIPLPVTTIDDVTPEIDRRLRKRKDIIGGWLQQSVKHRGQLNELIESINQYALPTTGSDHDAMLHYDQHRLYKESLLEQAIHTCIETENAIRMLGSVIIAIDYLVDGQPLGSEKASLESAADALEGDHALANSSLMGVLAAILLEQPKLVIEHFDSFLVQLHDLQLLYVPLARGGDPSAIVCARVVQTHILDLLFKLPAIGLLTQTHDLTKTALAMERNNPIGQGAVTEFDELFEVAYTAMVHVLVRSSDRLRSDLTEQAKDDSELTRKSIKHETRGQLFDCIEMLTESMLIQWLEHSRTLRLSVLEKVMDTQSWSRLVEFVQRYGPGLFTQQFLHAGNIRAILHQGVDRWLEAVRLQPPQNLDMRLIEELDIEIPKQKAVRYLTLVLESVAENYNEYRDYNTTTTQSDHGGSLYMLLDFLRLRTRYDRVCWNLKPVTWAHRILVREQKNNVARMWRQSLMERVGPEADKFLASLKSLRQKYSIHMASIGRRIEGKFAHQMQIDRLRSLVRPAMLDPTDSKCQRTFEMLVHEAQAFSRTTIGVGIDLPAWLAALENEVEQFQSARRTQEFPQDRQSFEVLPTSMAELRQQLEQLPRRENS